jgi:hypothetical protein
MIGKVAGIAEPVYEVEMNAGEANALPGRQPVRIPRSAQGRSSADA